MLEQVKGIRIKGRCFENETDLCFFEKINDRISIVYGKNGSGKSTISDGFSSIANNFSQTDLFSNLIDNQSNTVTLSDSSNIFVFNEKYTDENVKIDDDGLGSIVLLGGQVDLQEDIDKLSSALEEIEKDVEKLKTDYDEYLDTKNPLNPSFHWARLSSILKQSGGWAEIDSKIRGNRRNSSVTDDIISEICKITTKQTSAELQREFDETKTLLDKVSNVESNHIEPLPIIIFDEKYEDLLLKLLALKVEEPILSDREQLILGTVQNGGQSFVENARQKFIQENVDICPFCFQAVSETYKKELVSDINKILNKDVDEHIFALNSINHPLFQLDLFDFDSIDSKLVKQINDQLKKCNDIVNSYKEEITKKINNVYMPIILKSKGLKSEVNKLELLLKALEEKRIEFNDAVKRRDSLQKNLIFINKKIASLQTSQVYKDFVKQTKEKNTLQDKLSKKKKDFDNCKEELKLLQEQKSNISLAINSINNALDYVFFEKGRLSIELKNDKYYLKSNGNDVKPKNVSLGERNIIALCYFFTQIMSNQDISKLYTNEAFIVIDDPVSSFDFENKIGIISFLRYQINRVISGNSNSKVIVLSHDLEIVFHLRKAMEEICKSTKSNTTINTTTYGVSELSNGKLNQLVNKHNEYGILLKTIYNFASNNPDSKDITIGNVMRRVLEAFSTFNYRKGIEDVSCDKNILAALGEYSIYFENLMYRLVLHGESHYEEQIYSMHDGNNFYKFISDEEKKKTAKNILCFMYLLNPQHITAYFDQEKSVITDITSWIKKIPKNNSFEDLTSNDKRIIPLYYLPLSAGTGNDSFDDFPYVDYETDNTNCDFALKISGDSMEPNIKDDSIVLIKQSSIIDNGKIGAFYHNGKVYCKYLKHEHKDTYLCSYNNTYLPIKIKDEDTFIVYGEVIEIIEQ